MNKNENEAIDFEIGKLVAMKIAKDFNYSIDHKIETGMIDLQGIALPFLNAKDASYTTKLKVLEDLILDDVPHQYQRRLLEVLK